MLIQSFKKMNKNKWIYISLAFGLILTITSLIVIPMFSRASIDRLLIDTLTTYSTETSIYPLTMKYEFSPDNNSLDSKYLREIDELTSKLTQKYIDELSTPLFAQKQILYSPNFTMWNSSDDVASNANKLQSNFDMISMSSLDENITMVEGDLPSSMPSKDGVYEVIVDTYTFNSRDLSLDTIYNTYLKKDADSTLGSLKKNITPISFKIVGIFEIKKSDYWTKGSWSPGLYSIYIPEASHVAILQQFNNSKYINEYYLDYTPLKYKNLTKLNVTLNEINTSLVSYNNIHSCTIENVITADLESKMNSTKQLLFIILIPLIFMLFLYTLMISKIIAKNDTNEISTLKSRGAKLHHILNPYLIQGTFLGIISLAISPFLAKNIVGIMGSISNFLEFSNKNGLSPYISLSDYFLGILMIALFIITLIIPIYFLSKKSIVETKRDKLRIKQFSLWKKYFIDIILIAISSYAFFSYSSKRSMQPSDVTPIDPMIYVLISCMCLGLCLLFLRIYPYFINLIFNLGKKHWSPETYYTLTNNSKDFSKKEYIIIFLVFTLSTCIFNMNSARQMNNDGFDNINYLMGSDIVLKEYWEKQSPFSNYLMEPDYDKFSDIESVQNTSKVMKRDYCSLDNSKKKVFDMRLMSIVPEEFGKVAWMRSDLFPEDWYEHLNALTLNPNTILVSSNFLDAGFNLNDVVSLRIPKIEMKDSLEVYYINSRIIGTFDYWPGWNSEENPYLIVSNYNYIYKEIDPIPYEVWIDIDDSISSKHIYNDLKELDLSLSKFEAKDVELNSFTSDIFIQAINAAYTFAFLVTLIITFTGFMIYWILNIKDRSLQFGILRSLGISKFKVYKILIQEQILSTVVAIITGTLIGNFVFSFFGSVTYTQSLEGTKFLPGLIRYVSSDYLKVFTVVGVMLIIIMTILIIYISKLKISKAIRLGED